MTTANMTGRREFLAGSALLTLATAPGIAGAAAQKGDHQHHAGQNADLIEEALHCIGTGNACGAHCIMDLRSGNDDLLECLVRVNELVTACEALVQFAAYDSDHLKTFARATIEVCDTCEAECRKFEDLHQECADCADACASCREACEKVLS